MKITTSATVANVIFIRIKKLPAYILEILSVDS